MSIPAVVHHSPSARSPGAVAAVAALLPGCSDAAVSDAKHGRILWLLEDLSLLAAMRAICPNLALDVLT